MEYNTGSCYKQLLIFIAIRIRDSVFATDRNAKHYLLKQGAHYFSFSYARKLYFLAYEKEEVLRLPLLTAIFFNKLIIFLISRVMPIHPD